MSKRSKGKRGGSRRPTPKPNKAKQTWYRGGTQF